MNKYYYYKEQARQKAINWQYELSNKCYSYGELMIDYYIFYNLAKRYGLIKEFKENGII